MKSKPIPSILVSVFGALTIALFAMSGVLFMRGTEGHLPFAFAMVGLVALTYAAALRYASVATYAVGGKPALARTPRPARIAALRPAHS